MGDLEDLVIKMNMCNNEKLYKWAKMHIKCIGIIHYQSKNILKEIENYYKEILILKRNKLWKWIKYL